MKLHPDATEMKKVLDKYGIKNLYHFTAIDNLSIINKCKGIWSKQRLENDGLLDKIITGGNKLSLSLDKSIGNWDKVSLHFCPRSPMAYRAQQNFWQRAPRSAHICYLIIDPNVALWEGVVFTDTNATKTTNGQKRGQGMGGLSLVDFDTIKAHLNKQWVEPKQRWHRNVQAECLIPNEIPITYIKGIVFISEASLREGTRLWGNVDHPLFSIEKNLFSTDLALVNSFTLTSQNVTKDNVDSIRFQDEECFSKELCSKVTLLVHLYATACSQAQIIWFDNHDKQIFEDKTDFEKVSFYWHWPSLEIFKLLEGNYSVEYYLNDTRWFKAHFRVME